MFAGEDQAWKIPRMASIKFIYIVDFRPYRQSAKLEEKLSIECLFQMCVCCIIGIIAGGDRLADSTQGWHLVRAMSGLWPV